MTLKELIYRHQWLSIKMELIRLYPDEEKQIDAYRTVFDQLLEMTIEPSDIVIRLTEINDDDTYVDVDGYHSDGRVDPLSGNDALALDFTAWNQWLGMQGNSISLRIHK